MRRNRALLLRASALACVWITASSAETVTYTYDALGRLKASSVTGGAQAGAKSAICYDAAGNRVRYVTTTSGAITCATPAPSPTPTPASGGG